MADGVTKAVSMVRRIGKATPKIVGHALPVLSVGASALGAWNEGGGDAEKALSIGLLKFIPVNIQNGQFQTSRLNQGLFPFLISVVAGKIISSLA